MCVVEGGPLTYDVNKLDATLSLLRDLTTHAREENESDLSSTATVEAIGRTARAIQNILVDAAETIVFNLDKTEKENVEKRHINPCKKFRIHRRLV
ncbi:hypothetical protein ElyMa_000752800 [Elysia marginata]|uniref:Vinculin n=1 Tax=Elysia marginata TaxID=1093978 RepID=A0AAV4GRL7_9GAST|nr:hypothetical protein ElyMa_000752800 [Elysia marginata]